MSTTEVTLSIIAEKLSKWRSQKVRRNQPIPAEIKNDIVAISQHYSNSQLCKELNLNYKQLSAFLNANTSKPSYPKAIFAPSTPKDEEFSQVMLNFKAPILATIDNQSGQRLTLQVPSIAEAEIILNNFLHGARKC
jgi:hypothetical protein